jgi:acyl-CoA reductase-like NAD-dependent aldehyde dehydrogenase
MTTTFPAVLALYIDGEWLSGGGMAALPMATKADLDEALAAAQRAWPDWRATVVEKRAAILHKTAELLKERADHIAAILTQEQGKPIAEAASGRRIDDGEMATILAGAPAAVDEEFEVGFISHGREIGLA